MSPLSETAYDEMVGAIRSWPPAWRLRLAETILGSLSKELGSPPARGVPVEQVLGIAAGDGPPPDDETVRGWIEEHRNAPSH